MNYCTAAAPRPHSALSSAPEGAFSNEKKAFLRPKNALCKGFGVAQDHGFFGRNFRRKYRVNERNPLIYWKNWRRG
jgi:hypothetical protein